MKIGRGASQLAVVVACALLPAVLAKIDEQHGRRVPKQIHAKATVVDSDKDHNTAETGFDGHHGHGKYFQYQHNPEHDHYEFGYRRGNDHHFQERYEKAHPHAGHFKTKVRWGDKHGGYGEHYWDYNHAGHHDGGDDHHHHDHHHDHHHHDHHGHGGYSEPVPDYQPHHGHAKVTAKRQSQQLLASASTASASTDERVKRQPDSVAAASSAAPISAVEASRLVFDVASGTVVDEVTGQAYLLTPVQ